MSPRNSLSAAQGIQLQLVVTGHYANGEIADLTRAATLKFHLKALPKQESAVHQTLADGETNVAVSVGDCSTSMSLNVTNQNQGTGILYYEALPALSKAGCAAGGCHGAPHGKGEFRLSCGDLIL